MPGMYRQVKFQRARPAAVSQFGVHVPKSARLRLEQLPKRGRRNDDILRINGVRVTDKGTLIREAAGKYPILCQFEETGKRYQLSNAFRHWKRRFDDENSLKWALGDIEGPFFATFRPL